MSEKRTIAIVDDHALFRKSLGVLINMLPNFRVLFDAANGSEMISLIKTDQLPDIILMDISMPVMDGYAATVWVRDHHPGIKVIALSTMDSEMSIVKMIRSGAKGYILKDAEPEELRIAFTNVLTQGYFYNELITGKILRTVNHLTDTNHPAFTFSRLSEREIEFLKLVCTELTYKEIAEKLFVSVRTVEGYRDNLCEKLGLKTRVGLAMYAIKHSLVNL